MAVVGNLQINVGASTASLEDGMARAVRSIENVRRTTETTSSAVGQQMTRTQADFDKTGIQGAEMASTLATSLGAGGPITSALLSLDRALIRSKGNLTQFLSVGAQAAAVAAVAYVVSQFRKQAQELDAAVEQLNQSLGRMKAQGMSLRLQAAKEAFLAGGGTEEQWRGGRGAETLARLRAQEGDTSTLEESARRVMDRATAVESPEDRARAIVMGEIAAGRQMTDDAVRRLVAVFEAAEAAQKSLTDARLKDETLAQRQARETAEMNRTIAGALVLGSSPASEAALGAAAAMRERHAIEFRAEQDRLRMEREKGKAAKLKPERTPAAERTMDLGGTFAGAATRGSVDAYRAIIGSQTYGQQTAKNTATMAGLQRDALVELRNMNAATAVVTIQ